MDSVDRFTFSLANLLLAIVPLALLLAAMRSVAVEQSKTGWLTLLAIVCVPAAIGTILDGICGMRLGAAAGSLVILVAIGGGCLTFGLIWISAMLADVLT